MVRELIIAPEAQQDLIDAYGWYEERRSGLGEEFLTCVDACIQVLFRHPQRFAGFHLDYRRVLVRRFPYVVFYEFYPDIVTVYAVFHASRSPDAWRQRLP